MWNEAVWTGVMDGHSPLRTSKPLRFAGVDPLGITTRAIRNAAPESVKAITKHYQDMRMLQFHLSVMRRSVCAWASLDPAAWHVPVFSWHRHEFGVATKHSSWIGHPAVAKFVEEARAVVSVTGSAQSPNGAASRAQRPTRRDAVDSLRSVLERSSRAPFNSDRSLRR